MPIHRIRVPYFNRPCHGQVSESNARPSSCRQWSKALRGHRRLTNVRRGRTYHTGHRVETRCNRRKGDGRIARPAQRAALYLERPVYYCQPVVGPGRHLGTSPGRSLAFDRHRRGGDLLAGRHIGRSGIVGPPWALGRGGSPGLTAGNARWGMWRGVRIGAIGLGTRHIALPGTASRVS